LARPGDQGQGQGDEAVAEVSQAVAEQEADREQPPEGRVAETLLVLAIGGAEAREGRERQAGQQIDER
jgi:hypothetical protein